MKNIKLRSLLAALPLAAAALLAGCASVAPSTPETIVQQRAQKRLELLQVRDFDKAYEYLAPSYRAVNSLQAYRNDFGSGVGWVDPRASSVKCEDENRCIVTVNLGVRVVAPGFSKPIESTFWEIWVKDEDQWWFFKISN
ncbi:MAG: hypothetical protein KA775_04190 [Ottowia sp.]|jgi:hypothetical protein|nr:hypothetical protein [Ottowia sp.]TXJ05406.1 MAG: hypothetical protein E6Q29_12960 [Alicycliphilus sp.]